MASWDDEEFEPDNAVVPSQWDGEDEDDDDIKDNWDDEEDEDKKNEPVVPVSQPKKKKPLAERIKEKEEKKRQALLEKEEERKRLEELEKKELTPEELAAEKLRNQRAQEESDLELAKDAFGFGDPVPGQKTIDNFEPSNKDDFTELSSMISKKLTKYEHKAEYSTFLENLFRDLLVQVEPDDIKRISNTINILATEKQKLAKSAKGGKKKTTKKNTLVAGKGTRNDYDYGDNDLYNEYDDFM